MTSAEPEKKVVAVPMERVYYVPDRAYLRLLIRSGPAFYMKHLGDDESLSYVMRRSLGSVPVVPLVFAFVMESNPQHFDEIVERVMAHKCADRSVPEALELRAIKMVFDALREIHTLSVLGSVFEGARYCGAEDMRGTDFRAHSTGREVALQLHTRRSQPDGDYTYPDGNIYHPRVRGGPREVGEWSFQLDRWEPRRQARKRGCPRFIFRWRRDDCDRVGALLLPRREFLSAGRRCVDAYLDGRPIGTLNIYNAYA